MEAAESESESDHEEAKVAKEKKRDQKKATKTGKEKGKEQEKEKKSKKEVKEVPTMGGKQEKPKGQPEKKMMNEKEAYQAVLVYMEQQNRPYSIQNIMDNMHGRIPKKICENVLQKLTDQAHLVCKEFGKAKVYLANQNKFAETNPKQLEELDQTISDKR